MTDPDIRVLDARTSDQDHYARSLLVATEMDPWSSSTRYRALQYVTALRSRFARVAVSLPSDVVQRRPGRRGQAQYFVAHGQRYLHRCVAIRAELRRADVAFVQRGLYPLGPGLVTRPFDDYRGRVVLDLDDAVFETKPALRDRGSATRWLYGPQQALALMHRADTIIVSSRELLDALPPTNSTKVVLPTIPDVGRYPVVIHDDRMPVVIGWAGTVGNIRYLEPLRGVFRSLAQDRIAKLEVVSSEPWNGPSAFHPWTMADEASVFTRFGIGIMPLPDTPYTRAKAGFKLLQYMAAGIPIVASPVGVNSQLVKESGAGFLAETPGEWEEALRMLARDAALRQSLGERARSFVLAYAADSDNSRRLADILLTGSTA
jgi:hypothetical protein